MRYIVNVKDKQATAVDADGVETLQAGSSCGSTKKLRAEASRPCC